jgi:hypothetical protein
LGACHEAFILTGADQYRLVLYEYIKYITLRNNSVIHNSAGTFNSPVRITDIIDADESDFDAGKLKNFLPLQKQTFSGGFSGNL